jgi:hypothetical protein
MLRVNGKSLCSRLAFSICSSLYRDAGKGFTRFRYSSLNFRSDSLTTVVLSSVPLQCAESSFSGVCFLSDIRGHFSAPPSRIFRIVVLV